MKDIIACDFVLPSNCHDEPQMSLVEVFQSFDMAPIVDLVFCTVWQCGKDNGLVEFEFSPV